MYDITLRHIELFLTVAETNTLTKAAEMLFLSQPTVSKWMAHLEHELGVRLFYRRRGGVILTDKGLELYKTWSALYRELLAAADELTATPETK